MTFSTMNVKRSVAIIHTIVYYFKAFMLDAWDVLSLSLSLGYMGKKNRLYQ